MTECIEESRLRAYLDGELPLMERAAVGAHLAGCAACKGQLAAQRALAAQAHALLAAPQQVPDPRAALLAAPQQVPDPRAALARLRQANQSAGYVATNLSAAEQRSNPMQATSMLSGRRRSLLAALAAVVAVLSLLALPPVRAAADDLLSIFRVQKVLFLPVTQERLQQLASLNFDKNTLFITKPTGEPPALRTVASAAEANAAVRGQVKQPSAFPSAPLSTEFLVNDPAKLQFQINVQAARQVLNLMGIDDVTLPDELGSAPIVVDTPAFAVIRYHGANYDMRLHQGPSPSVTLPEGVELEQLGKAALRLFGMTREQAEATSQSINWNNTLIFPFPADTSNIRQVTVHGQPGLLASGGVRGHQNWQLYWQEGDKLYMLQASGPMRDNDMVAELLATAESIN